MRTPGVQDGGGGAVAFQEPSGEVGTQLQHRDRVLRSGETPSELGVGIGDLVAAWQNIKN